MASLKRCFCDYDRVDDLVTARVKETSGRISAKWLLPAARTAGNADIHRSPDSDLPIVYRAHLGWVFSLTVGLSQTAVSTAGWRRRLETSWRMSATGATLCTSRTADASSEVCSAD